MVAPTRKGVAVTRSFGRPVTALAEMREAVAHHAVRADPAAERHLTGHRHRRHVGTPAAPASAVATIPTGRVLP
jgi:hypothetical protein